VRAPNRFKNRSAAPSADDINPVITMAAILAPGADIGRWRVRNDATISGYVYDVKPGGVETANCHATDRVYRHTHTELVLDAMQCGGTTVPDAFPSSATLNTPTIRVQVVYSEQPNPAV
jgi:hypothetical protein